MFLNNIFIKNIKEIKKIGLKILAKDYGTNTHTYEYFDIFDYFKINLDFILNLPKEIQLNTLEFLISLCNKNKKELIIENVNDFDKFSILKNFENGILQGDLYSKPIKSNEFLKISKLKFLKKELNEKKLDNQREYFRIKLIDPITSITTITKIKGKKVNLKETTGLIDNIGPGGFSIALKLNLPQTEEMILSFKIKIFSEKFNLEGIIKWKKQLENDINLYGIHLYMNEVERNKLFKTLNKLSVYLKNGEVIEDSNIYKGNYISFFKNLDN